MHKLNDNNWFFICIAIAILGFSLAVFGAIKASHSQDLSVEQFIDIASTAKVGNIIQKKDNIEIRKADNNNKITAKIYSTPQYDKSGNPIIKWETADNKITSKGHYLKYIPDESTYKLTTTREITNTDVKECHVIPSANITKLSWGIDTDLKPEIDNDNLVFKDVLGDIIFTTSPPVAWDNSKKAVSVKWDYNSYILNYTIIYDGDVKFPVTVDPTTTTINRTNYFGAYSYNADFNTARNVTIAKGSYGHTVFGVTADYYVIRSFATYDLSGITATSVLSCSLYVYSKYDYNAETIKPVLGNFAGTAYDSTYFNDFYGWQSAGTYNTYVIDATTSALSPGSSASLKGTTLSNAALDTLRTKVGKPALFKVVYLVNSDYGGGYSTPKTITMSTPFTYLVLTYIAPPSINARKFLYNNEPFYLWKNGNNIPLYKK